MAVHVMKPLELTKAQQQYRHSAVGAPQPGTCLHFKLRPVWQLGQWVMHRKVVGMLLSCDASHVLVPLVYDATDAEYDQCNADKVQEYWLFALRAEESIQDR